MCARLLYLSPFGARLPLRRLREKSSLALLRARLRLWRMWKGLAVSLLCVYLPLRLLREQTPLRPWRAMELPNREASLGLFRFRRLPAGHPHPLPHPRHPLLEHRQESLPKRGPLHLDLSLRPSLVAALVLRDGLLVGASPMLPQKFKPECRIKSPRRGQRCLLLR